jgi:hypothetical protein
MHSSTIRSAIVCAAVILVVIGGSQPAAAGSRWHPRKPHSHLRGPHLQPRQSQTYELAVFEWHQLSGLDDEVSPHLRWLRSEGFTTVYADFGEYIEAAEAANQVPRDEQSIRRLAQLGHDLRRFVAFASSLGLEVHAVSGGPNWINSLDYLAPLMIELVGDYNKSASREERLRGVQLDIEPHADPLIFGDTIDEQRATLLAYLNALEKAVDKYRKVRGRYGNRGLRLGFAIPFWFDDEPEAAPPVVFGETGKPATSAAVTMHLFDMLKNLSDAYVVVMAYRNRTDQPDGSIALATREFEYATKIDARFGIVVGQEFNKVDPPDPPKITFWCVGKAAFRRAAREITTAFGGYPQFRGLSVNDMDAYRATPEYVSGCQ